MEGGLNRKAWSSRKSLSRRFFQEAGVSNALPVASIGVPAALVLRVLCGLFLRKKPLHAGGLLNQLSGVLEKLLHRM